MTCDNGLCTSNKKWIKTRMKTSMHLDSKGNEVIILCSFNIWSCLFLNNHHHCMCYHHWCSLHHIFANQISNDDVHQGLETVFGNKDIHLLSGVAREKMGDLPFEGYIVGMYGFTNVPRSGFKYIHYDLANSLGYFIITLIVRSSFVSTFSPCLNVESFIWVFNFEVIFRNRFKRRD
jgi:hypothetical protein